jgi:hypothetical protein
MNSNRTAVYAGLLAGTIDIGAERHQCVAAAAKAPILLRRWFPAGIAYGVIICVAYVGRRGDAAADVRGK